MPQEVEATDRPFAEAQPGPAETMAARGCNTPRGAAHAEIEAACARARAAPDTPPLDALQLAAVAPCEWARTRLTLQPSVEVVRPEEPVLSPGQADGGSAPPVRPSEEQWALVARSGDDIEVHAISAGVAHFIADLMGGACVGVAARAAKAHGFDLVAGLALLFKTGLIVAIERPSDDCAPESASR